MIPYRDVSVCLLVTQLRCEKTAERIEVLIGVETPRDPRQTVWFPYGESGLMRPSPNYFGSIE